MAPRIREQWRDGFEAMKKLLFKPVSIESLVFFRIAFGAVMLWEVIRYFQYDWIRQFYMLPGFHFTYDFFHWVQPWPGNGMIYHFLILGVLALFILLGLFYRASSLLFFLGFGYIFLLDKAQFLNHFYFVVLVSFLLIFVPANHYLSIDSKIGLAKRSRTIPFWAVFLIAFQLGVVYFFGGIAKISHDWLHGVPLNTWLAKRGHLSVIGPYLGEKGVVYFFSYAGLLFDLFIVPLLIWRKTRVFAFLGAIAFHLTNATLFNIGIFPWLSLLYSTIFFSPDWPSKNWNRIKKQFFARSRDKEIKGKINRESAEPFPVRNAVLWGIGVYVAFQCLMPVRHFLYPGDVNWTEEGHRFSWHMKLRSKRGICRFTVQDKSTFQKAPIELSDFLTRRQRGKLCGRPDMIQQFAHYLKGFYGEKYDSDIAVYVESLVSLNTRPAQAIVDPRLDLASIPVTPLKRSSFIVPLEYALPTW